tara:strand:+ start:432 stop:728 length:297 start_codon:yes stop_codon:yes gene_type:complete
MRFSKILFLFLTIFALSGCLQSTALIGPGITLASTGNIMQAGFQYGANTAIKKETGKDAFTLVKEVVEEDQKKRKYKKDFIAMVKKRVEKAKKKISIN